MSHTPRNSSIRSGRTRMPSTLRIPSSTPRSTSHISRVFAAGDSATDRNVTSEEKLQKQLDSDAGGRTMGLRSRRGSGATVKTNRTVSGIGSPVEEEEPAAAAEDPPDDRPTRKLNPKTSSSWQRWNNPAPSFPRASSGSRDKGKGKQREDESEPNGLLQPPPDPQTPVGRSGSSSELTESTEPTPLPPTSPAIAPAPTDTEVSKRWWSRTAPSTPGPSTPCPSKQASKHAPKEQREEPVPPPIVPSESTVERAEDTTVAPPAPEPAKPEPAKAEPAKAGPAKAEPSKAEALGWRGYLWGSKAVKVADPAAEQPPVEAATPVPAVNGDSAKPLASQASVPDPAGPPTGPTFTSAPAPASNSAPAPTPTSAPAPTSTSAPASGPTDQDLAKAAPATASPAPAQAPGGWSSYLYSFVAKPKAPETSESTTVHSVEPTSPTEYQKPAPSSIPSSSTLAVPSTDPPPPLHDESPDPPNSLRKASVASHSGWLNYLASRASQKKLANASTASIKSGKERRSMETTEEVMDFSADPDFPDAKAETKPKDGSKDSKDLKAGSIKDKVITKKASQNLDVRQRAPSIASNKSSVQIPPSPKPRPKSSGSALPPPPTPAQPNFVIPTFADTFDRPPRSLPPRPQPQGSGLAWRAIGAVGSYVYGGDEKPAGETRGLKEGRRVGAGLPRKLGLTGRSADEGWKNVKRVAVVGVHGWFPAKMLNSVIGEPTGTSVKFANMMGAAVRKFFKDRGVEDLRITLMPLEGEGTIESRVDRLYKAYLSNPAWINDLRRADAVFFAAHSQGCIVTTHLISRMIAQGHIRTPLNKEAVSRCEWAFGPIGVVPDTPRRRGYTPSGAEGGNQKVAMLAMCGVHLGPLYSISTSTVIQPYLQWFENAAARELFEFQESDSAVSAAYQKALSMVLENEVRVVLLASYNDQVVPIYGASFCTANHPLLLRALFVDGASYAASDFMTNLLCFAFMLRNAGIDDQRLVEHLSEATAGSLTGVGHSTPYEDPGCYDLAVKYLFLSGPAQQPIPPLSIEPFSAREARSDFELPWIMRALVDSLEVRDLFPSELKDLREGVVAWRPVTKALREIKRRLEPMAGKSRLRIANPASSTSLNEMSPASGKVRSRL